MTREYSFNVFGTKLAPSSSQREKLTAAIKLGSLVGLVLLATLYLAFSSGNPASDLYRDSQDRALASMENMGCTKTSEKPADYSHTLFVFSCPGGTTEKVLVTSKLR